jgi:hypothetical protein
MPPRPRSPSSSCRPSPPGTSRPRLAATSTAWSPRPRLAPSIWRARSGDCVARGSRGAGQDEERRGQGSADGGGVTPFAGTCMGLSLSSRFCLGLSSEARGKQLQNQAPCSTPRGERVASMCRGAPRPNCRRRCRPASRAGRPIRAKTYGKKREHGRKSYDFDRAAAVLLRRRHQLAVCCVQSWRANAVGRGMCHRQGFLHAINRGANAGDDFACNTCSRSYRCRTGLDDTVPRQPGA